MTDLELLESVNAVRSAMKAPPLTLEEMKKIRQQFEVREDRFLECFDRKERRTK